MTRFAVIVLAAALAAGCPASSDEAGAPEADGDGAPGGAANAECSVDSECTPAGESCCACPSFAVPVSSGWDDSCEDVSCDEPPSCPTEAACDRGQCVLRCTAVACDPSAQCEGGFARDAAGCLSCECAAQPDPSAAQCQVDGDCVQVAADCCGCAEGGSDTAVPAAEADQFARDLGCNSSPSCPGVDVCDPAAIPRCIAGTCALSAGSGDTDGGLDGEAALCGTPELPVCPAGQACVVNDPNSPQASEMGVGVCR